MEVTLQTCIKCKSKYIAQNRNWLICPKCRPKGWKKKNYALCSTCGKLINLGFDYKPDPNAVVTKFYCKACGLPNKNKHG